MPIAPDNRSRYPANWPLVRAGILARAGDACEGSPAYPDCRAPNGWIRNKRTEELTRDPMQAETWALIDGDPCVRIVLTIAHLDHQPENCDPDNLRAWCQRCHLAYDAQHHQHSRRAGRRDYLTLPMFGAVENSPVDKSDCGIQDGSYRDTTGAIGQP